LVDVSPAEWTALYIGHCFAFFFLDYFFEKLKNDFVLSLKANLPVTQPFRFHVGPSSPASRETAFPAASTANTVTDFEPV
jgi:hypothetical protein